MENEQHSILAPSSAARRVVCPGSRVMEAQFPDTESKHAEEGHEAHYVAQKLLFTNEMPTGPAITSEMVDGAYLYKKHVDSITVEILNGVRTRRVPVMIENAVSIDSVHPDCWGTPDCWWYSSGQLHIWDYKFGHKYVEVFENWQLIEYSAGILKHLDYARATTKITVNMHIIQPRCFTKNGPINTWSISANDLGVYFTVLKAAEYAAMEPDAPRIPSAQCEYCSARHVCNELKNAAKDYGELATQTHSHNDSAELAVELAALEETLTLVKARLTGLSQEALTRIQRGEEVPGYRATYGRGREVWGKEDEEIIALGELYGKNLAKPQEAITPKQAIALKMPIDIIKQYSEHKSGKLELARDTTAIKLFGGVK